MKEKRRRKKKVFDEIIVVSMYALARFSHSVYVMSANSAICVALLRFIFSLDETKLKWKLFSALPLLDKIWNGLKWTNNKKKKTKHWLRKKEGKENETAETAEWNVMEGKRRENKCNIHQ